MTLTLYTSNSFEKRWRKLPADVRARGKKQLRLLLADPRHPSLRNHKLAGNLKKYWSISLDSDFRIIYQYHEDGILLRDVGRHREVY